MEGMEFVFDLGVWRALMIVVVAILLDAVIGILKTFKPEEEDFDIRKLPQFIGRNIFPYVGGLAAVALVVDRVGEPFDMLFYPFAAAVLAKYLAEVKDKLTRLFGVSGV